MSCSQSMHKILFIKNLSHFPRSNIVGVREKLTPNLPFLPLQSTMKKIESRQDELS